MAQVPLGRLIVLAPVVAAAAVVVVVVDGPSTARHAQPGRAVEITAPPPALDTTRVPRGARHVSPRGDDADPGTARRPWRTIGYALRRARPGSTVVLHPGRYGGPGQVIAVRRSGTKAKPITLRSAPGRRRARLVGLVRVTASHVRLSGLVFDGPTGPVRSPDDENPRGEEVPLAIYGRHVTLARSEVRDSAWHAGVYLEGVRHARLVGNHIHDNGDRGNPANANLDHGIYWSSGSGEIVNNLVTGNVARGVQLYPGATGVDVLHNTIVGNGRAGIQLGDDAASNFVSNNIVVSNGDTGIRSDALTGQGNRVVNNIVWGNTGDGTAEKLEGLAISRTVSANPRLDAAGCPRTESPAIDRALESRVRRDRTGRPRPAGDSDIGACESRR